MKGTKKQSNKDARNPTQLQEEEKENTRRMQRTTRRRKGANGGEVRQGGKMIGVFRISPENVGNKCELQGSLAGTGGRNRP